MALSGSIPSNGNNNTYWLEIVPSTNGNVVSVNVILWSKGHPGGYAYATGSAFPLKVTIGGQTLINKNHPIVTNDWTKSVQGDGRTSYVVLGSASLATGGGATTVYAEYTNNYSNHNWAMKLYQKLSVSDTVYPVTPGNPSVNVGYSNVGRTTATISGSVTSWGDYASAGSYNLACSDGSSGQNTSRNLTNLTPNTNYTVTFSATNNYGKSASKSTSFTTAGNAPVINEVTTTLTPSTCTFNADVTYDTNDSFGWMFLEYGLTPNCDNHSQTWTIDNLTPGTTYYYKLTISSQKGRQAIATGTFTTPTDQAKARLKINGVWTKGKVFFKKNGEWVATKKIFTKKNGEWTETKN